ncbi:thioredoxin family protein [Salinibius halmophilus]|uniref:thioredoxin family protein n=1 Tax=Salinibius halmophilus TaxID=1853216 RepID=UPI000E662550|nr:thioredoxin family protein [Salinibius halmophilus]
MTNEPSFNRKALKPFLHIWWVGTLVLFVLVALFWPRTEKITAMELFTSWSSSTAELAALDPSLPAIVYFRTDWCPYCKELEEDTLRLAEVHEALGPVPKFMFNPELDVQARELADALGNTGYPGVWVLNANSRTYTKISPFENGFSLGIDSTNYFVKRVRRHLY